jgi:hypothetical protein
LDVGSGGAVDITDTSAEADGAFKRHKRRSGRYGVYAMTAGRKS